MAGGKYAGGGGGAIKGAGDGFEGVVAAVDIGSPPLAAAAATTAAALLEAAAAAAAACKLAMLL